MLNRVCQEPSDTLLTVICHTRDDPTRPVGLAVLRRGSVDAPVSIIGSDVTQQFHLTAATARHIHWEILYVVRRPDFRGQAIGDILLSTALDHLWTSAQRQRTSPTLTFWLVLSGFDNIPALQLYSRYSFEVKGWHTVELGPFMALQTLDTRKHGKIRATIQRQLELTFLFPRLKRQRRIEDQVNNRAKGFNID